ncbi:hypothetical protein [Chitinophaga defluvii]|uniref:Uncharacterized protein n=1 Tax=Chitinophaga defluvii TaxID=3163343 RepID=A0ABV2T8N7_9BACT
MKLGFSPEAICGISDASVILSGRNNAEYTLFGVREQKLTRIDIDDQLQQSLKPPVNIVVNDSDILFLINNSATLMRGRINNDRISGFEKIKLDAPLFTRVSPFTPGALILRAFDSTSKYQHLQKVDLKTGTMLAVADIFGHSRGEMFLTDGMLDFDSVNSSAIYIQYYSNKIYCLDSNLNLKYISKTIDTVGTGDITAASRTVSVGTRETFVPPITINERSSTDEGYLFVLSNLKADNETDRNFINNSTFDVYQTGNGRYIGSFHLPTLNGHKVDEFMIRNRTLYVLCKNFYATYKIFIEP